jgi:MFS family permease
LRFHDGFTYRTGGQATKTGVGRAVVRRREAVWLFGISASLFGSNALMVAAVVWIQHLTGSPALASFALFTYLAPSILSPVSGLIADRVRRARLLITTDLCQAAWVCLALLVHSGASVWIVYVVLVGVSLGVGLEAPAAAALLTTVVEPARLGRVNSIFRTCKDLSRTLAPGLGVLIYSAFGMPTLILLDVATFLVSVCCVWQLRAREPVPASVSSPILREMVAGARYILATPLLRRVVGTVGVVLLAFGMFEPTLIYLIKQGLHISASFYGVTETVKNVGSIVGGVVCVRVIDRLGAPRLVRVGLAMMALGTLPLLVPQPVVVAVGCFIVGVGVPMGLVGYLTVVMQGSPSNLQGRVMAATDTAVTGPQALAVALGSALVGQVPYQVLLLTMTVVVGLCALSLTRSRLTAPPATVPVADGASGVGDLVR